MTYADRVKDTTTTVGTGTITLSNVAPTGYQTFAAGLPASSTVPYCISSQSTAEWEVGNGVLLTSTTLSRSPTASSNAGGLVNFSAGTKDVFCTLPAGAIAKLLSSDDVSFSASVPFTAQGIRYMPQQTVGSVIAFTPNSTGAVKNSQVYVRLLADAVNVPTFVGFKEWGGSLGYDNRSLIANQITFWFDGYDYWFSVSQAVGAVATPVAATGISLGGPSSGVVSTASSNFTVGVLAPGSTIAGTIIVTPSDAAGGGTFLPTTVSLTSGSPTGTFTYTPNATVATRTISVTNNAALTPPTAISYSVTASATAPATMVAPTVSGTPTSSSIALAFVAPAANGSSITSYTVTPYIGATAQTVFTTTTLTSPVTVTGLTAATAYTFTIYATNGVGAGTASPASGSISTAAAAFLRMIALSSLTESGTGPYTYNNVPGSFGTQGGVLNKTLAASTDGSFAIRNTSGPEFIMAIPSSSTAAVVENFTTCPYGIYTSASAGGAYQVLTGGALGAATNSVTNAVNDILRIRRSGTSLIAEVARTATPTTFTTLFTWASVTRQLSFEVNTSTCSFDTLTGVSLA